MSHPTVASTLVQTLRQAGVSRIYGLVGDSLNRITDEIRKAGLQWIHVRHEETAAFAAGAEAQLTGKLAVCAGSCGPGNMHLINGLYDAQRSYAPVLAIASHIPASEIGTGYFQETKPELLFRECSHYCELVSNARQVPRLFHIAIQNSLARRGVSVVVLPGDLSGVEVPADAFQRSIPDTPSVVRPNDRGVQELADAINNAQKVTLFCGSGCAGCHREIMALAERIHAPVGHALKGKMYVQFSNPFDVGMTGMLGYGSAYQAMHGCDLLLLLGTDFPYDAFMPTTCKIAQIDTRAENLGRRSRLDLGLCGDVGETLRALLPLVTPKPDRIFLDAMVSQYAHAKKKLNIYVDHVSSRRPIHPEYVAAMIDAVAADDAIFTVDTGMCNVWSARYLSTTGKRAMIGSFTHGSMANAVPQAIGAAVSHPGRQVVTFSGDGGLAMMLGDLLTLVQHKLPVKVVVFNNSSLGMVKLEMEAAGFMDWGTDNLNPNFARVAEAIGIPSVRVEDPSQVKGSLESMLNSDGPALIDVVTDPNALSMPPHIDMKQAVGFALTMGKLSLSGHIDEVVQTIAANARLIRP